MTSILSKLTRHVIKWVEYGSYLDILRNQERYLRLATRNHTAKYNVSLTRFKFYTLSNNIRHNISLTWNLSKITFNL